MADVRKNQAKLTSQEWQAFIEAINAMHRRRAAAPSYREFVRVHLRSMGPTGHDWGVHSMPGMLGRNFLTWHRQYLRAFELRLQRENPNVTIPYWDWIADRRLPRRLNRRELLRRWGIERFWSRDFLPERTDLNAATRRAKFPPFQRLLEQVHNNVHLAVGGQMATAESPADPLFWLHHANIDRIWARWQERHPRARPRNATERLQPSPMFGNRVSGVLSIRRLGYRYG